MTRYDTIGQRYAEYRTPDPRLAKSIDEALGDARRVVNVGAGAGSYEPTDRSVVAVEPSATMLGQRGPGAARVVQGSAESLPFAEDEFDAAMAVLTIHHWKDWERGVGEMARVARRVVILTWDPAHTGTVQSLDVGYRLVVANEAGVGSLDQTGDTRRGHTGPPGSPSR